MRSSSTLLTRLALALLALTGFVAPLSAMEVDRVVQTAGGKPSAVEEVAPHATVKAAAAALSVAATPAAQPLASATAEVVRRYLMHRAWLL